jgi:membrane fusion protein (multidrug efflux system)
MQRIKSSLLPAIALVVIGAALAGAQAPPTLVETDTVQSLEFSTQLTLVGRAEPRVNSRIVSEVSGRVARIDAPEGNPVGVGEPLVTIAPERIQFDLNAKEAEVIQAKTQEDLARSNLGRAEDLYKQQLIRKITYDSAQAWVTASEANRKRLEAERDRLALDRRNATIRAPYSGYTLRRLVDIGEWVNPGTPVYEMVDLGEITVTVDLPERYFGQLSIGSPVMIRVSSDTANVYTGTVTGVARSGNETTHTFPVIVAVPNPAGKLGGGNLVQATLSLNERFSSLAVSKDAIIRQGMQTMVYTIADGKAAPIPVVTKSTSGEMVSVEGNGLAEGMPVVVRGNERIFPGSPVRTAEPEAPGSASIEGQEE